MTARRLTLAAVAWLAVTSASFGALARGMLTPQPGEDHLS